MAQINGNYCDGIVISANTTYVCIVANALYYDSSGGNPSNSAAEHRCFEVARLQSHE